MRRPRHDEFFRDLPLDLEECLGERDRVLELTLRGTLLDGVDVLCRLGDIRPVGLLCLLPCVGLSHGGVRDGELGCLRVCHDRGEARQLHGKGRCRKELPGSDPFSKNGQVVVPVIPDDGIAQHLGHS